MNAPPLEIRPRMSHMLPRNPAPAPRRAFQETLMSGFDDRKKAQEGKFAHDQETLFKATARRNKLLGLWAAGKIGLSGEAAEAYAKEVVKADFEEKGDEDVFRKVKADLDAKSAGVSEHQIRREMETLLQTALEQVKAGQ